nr:MAG TPA: polyA polymerase [Caudoviricetes sp.]DAP02321.1 MAG TPA: polyA polymerase [Caudoviricetes sp.]
MIISLAFSQVNTFSQVFKSFFHFYLRFRWLCDIV